MTICYLALGSNLKNPQRELWRALEHLKCLPKSDILKYSKWYFSKAWGRKSQPNFYNAVVAIKTALPPKALLKYCQSIENKHKRQRKIRFGARTLDIDIILYGSQSIHFPKLLTIPHPRLLERDFVLIPLQELRSCAC